MGLVRLVIAKLVPTCLVNLSLQHGPQSGMIMKLLTHLTQRTPPIIIYCSLLWNRMTPPPKEMHYISATTC